MRARSVIVLGAGAVVVLAVVLAWATAPVWMRWMTPAGALPASEKDDDFGTVEVYVVDEAGTLDPAAEDAATADVWDLFVRVVTPEFAAAGMTEYRVGDAPDSDTMAYVHRDDDPEYWVLAANLAYADDEQLLLSTLIHEYGHILSLDTGDVDPEVAECRTWEISEGCVAADSALALFDEQFWLPYGDEAPTPEAEDSDAAYEFYLEHEEDFVSDYAATNVVEDFAESFMTFVLEPESDADTPIAQKLAFFSGLPEYVEVRERLRAEFALD